MQELQEDKSTKANILDRERRILKKPSFYFTYEESRIRTDFQIELIGIQSDIPETNLLILEDLCCFYDRIGKA